MGQKLRLANWKLMQTNSHMLAELNLGRDRNWRFGDAPIVAGNSVGQNWWLGVQVTAAVVAYLLQDTAAQHPLHLRSKSGK
uniref:Uncharacterized protein n=1 Tax=Oryza punctata TaxID=4537 RepID=A0A0E0K416_ORYPU